MLHVLRRPLHCSGKYARLLALAVALTLQVGLLGVRRVEARSKKTDGLQQFRFCCCCFFLDGGDSEYVTKIGL